MFAAFAVPNFRLYFAGQAVSMVGTWMQVVAQSWLVLDLTGSGTALGLVVAAQFLPVLLLAPYGGLIADRVDNRRLLMTTQTGLGSLSLLLGLLTITGAVRLWMVVVVAVLLGSVAAVGGPTRQTFLPEVVGTHLLRNAVSITSVMISATRAVGPAVAGLWVPLVMMALIGTLAYEFQVVLPVLARFGIHGGARTYGFLASAMGLGAVVGGLIVAAFGRAGVVPLVGAAAGFGAALSAATFVPSLPGELAALAFVGVGSIAFLATDNTTLQLVADPSFRGRVSPSSEPADTTLTAIPPAADQCELRRHGPSSRDGSAAGRAHRRHRRRGLRPARPAGQRERRPHGPADLAGPAGAARRICAATGSVLDRQRWRQYIPELPYDPPCPGRAGP